MFRGKESSNRIELSRLVQELLNFGVFGFLQLLGVVGGCPPQMCTHAHAYVVNMVISCKWPPPLNLGKIPGIPYDVICACAWMCTWVGCTLSSNPTPIHPSPHPPGDPQNHSKFNSTWTNRDISILFEDLKSVETPPPIGGCIIWWVGGLVDGWHEVKSLKFENCWLNQDNSNLFEDLWLPVGGCVDGWCGWVGGCFNGWGQVNWLKI